MTEPRNARLVTDDGQEFPVRLSQLPGKQEWVAYADWDRIRQRLGPDIRIRLLADDWDPGQTITFGPQFSQNTSDAMIRVVEFDTQPELLVRQVVEPRQPRTWAMPAEPPADVMKLRDRDGFVWRREAVEFSDQPIWRRSTGAWSDDFVRLLTGLGPLTEVVDDQ